MTITLTLPDDIAQHPDPGREALETLVIEGYRSGTLTAYETRRLLGFETRYELDIFLKDHNIWENAYSLEDLQVDRQTFALLDAKAGR